MNKAITMRLSGWLFVTLVLCLLSGMALAVRVTDFSAKTHQGDNFVLSQELKGKAVVMNFWASWCEACAEEIDTLNSLKERYQNRKDISFVAVNAGDSESAIARFLRKTGFAYLIVSDQDKSISKKFGVMGLPQTLVISSKGEIVYQKSIPPESLDEYLVETKGRF